MNTPYNVLIIDDHQIIIYTFKNALQFVEKDLGDFTFNIDDATCCESALEKIKKASKAAPIDLVFLDIKLPALASNHLSTGEDIGIYIRHNNPDTKIIVCTNVNDDFKLDAILETINPDGFLIKSDITFEDLIHAIKNVINNTNFYSETIVNLIQKRMANPVRLDNHDMVLLYEMSNGAKMEDLLKIIPLTKSGIEKRKRVLKEKFKITSNSDRDLILVAMMKGYI